MSPTKLSGPAPSPSRPTKVQLLSLFLLFSLTAAVEFSAWKTSSTIFPSSKSSRDNSNKGSITRLNFDYDTISKFDDLSSRDRRENNSRRNNKNNRNNNNNNNKNAGFAGFNVKYN